MLCGGQSLRGNSSSPTELVPETRENRNREPMVRSSCSWPTDFHQESDVPTCFWHGRRKARWGKGEGQAIMVRTQSRRCSGGSREACGTSWGLSGYLQSELRPPSSRGRTREDHVDSKPPHTSSRYILHNRKTKIYFIVVHKLLDTEKFLLVCVEDKRLSTGLKSVTRDRHKTVTSKTTLESKNPNTKLNSFTTFSCFSWLAIPHNWDLKYLLTRYECWFIYVVWW